MGESVARACDKARLTLGEEGGEESSSATLSFGSEKGRFERSASNCLCSVTLPAPETQNGHQPRKLACVAKWSSHSSLVGKAGDFAALTICLSSAVVSTAAVPTASMSSGVPASTSTVCAISSFCRPRWAKMPVEGPA